MYEVNTIQERECITADRLMVSNAKHLGGYRLSIYFNDGNNTIVDFSGFLSKTKGYLEKYKKPDNFKKYSIINGNLAWGKHRDLIFPIEQLYEGHID